MTEGQKSEQGHPVKSVRFDPETLKFVGKFQKKTGLDFSNALRLMIRKVAEFHGWAR